MTKPAKPNTRHGLSAPMAQVKLRGISAIDRRTVAARALLHWRSQLVGDLGGADNLTAQKLLLVDLAARTKALVDSVDAYLLASRSIVNRRRGSLLPIIGQRQQLCDSLSRLLQQLGIERAQKPAPTLAEYVSRRKESA